MPGRGFFFNCPFKEQMDVLLWFHFLKPEIAISMGVGSSECSQESSGSGSWGRGIRGAEIRNPCLLTLPSHTHKYVLSALLNIVLVTKMIKT